MLKESRGRRDEADEIVKKNKSISKSKTDKKKSGANDNEGEDTHRFRKVYKGMYSSSTFTTQHSNKRLMSKSKRKKKIEKSFTQTESFNNKRNESMATSQQNG